MEDEELWTGAHGKQFIIDNDANGDGATSTALRTYGYASAMLTFNFNSLIWYTHLSTGASLTPLSLFPEIQLVPANPVVATPTSVASLKVGNVYVREWNDCFINNVDQGACAFVVNPTASTQTVPTLSKTYTRTLVMSGEGVLNGGTIATNGAAPPSSLLSGTAYIAFR